MPRRIGVLTGGGDVPGLNACIKSVVLRAEEEGVEVVGVRRGWMGLLHFNPTDRRTREQYIVPLDRGVVRTIDRSGGTFLHTSRTHPGRVRDKELPAFLSRDGALIAKVEEPDAKTPLYDCTRHVLRAIEALGVDALIAIGGDDTLSYAERLHREGVPVCAIPKTMDNDVHGTDYCIGFSTAVTRSVEFIHQLRTSAGSHERLAVVELFGRYSGETSLIAAHLAGVDRALISEVPFDPDRLARFLVTDKHENPSHYAMVTVSEGAAPIGGEMLLTGEADAFGHRKLGGIGVMVAEDLKRRTGENTIYQPLSYLMRSGAPDSLDLMVATNYATLAVSLILRGERGRLVALQGGVYTNVPIETLSAGRRRVDVDELYDTQNYRPKIRDVHGKPMFLY
jgi:6-phosphofructokinase 1